MSDFVNPTTCQLAPSVNDMPEPWIACTRAQTVAWGAINPIYRKWTGSAVEEMTQGEKTAFDAAALESSRDSAVHSLDNFEDTMRAFAQVIADGFNAHAARTNAILAAIDGAASLAALKTAVAGINDLPTYNMAGLRAAIRAKLGT